MRVAVDQIGQQAHAFHQCTHAFLDLCARRVRFMGDHGLSDDFAHGHAWVQCGKRILKDHLYIAPVHTAFARVHVGQIGPFKKDIAPRGGDCAHNRAGDG